MNVTSSQLSLSDAKCDRVQKYFDDMDETTWCNTIGEMKKHTATLRVYSSEGLLMLCQLIRSERSLFRCCSHVYDWGTLIQSVYHYGSCVRWSD